MIKIQYATMHRKLKHVWENPLFKSKRYFSSFRKNDYKSNVTKTP